MIIYGAVLGCLSPLLSIAAGLSCRSPFLSTGDPAKREAIDAAKKRMAAAGGGRSDHTLLAVAVAEWEASAAEGGGDRARRRFCAANGINFERMRELTEVRQQLAQALAGIGFIPSARAAFDPRASVNAQARDALTAVGFKNNKIVTVGLFYVSGMWSFCRFHIFSFVFFYSLVPHEKSVLA